MKSVRRLATIQNRVPRKVFNSFHCSSKSRAGSSTPRVPGKIDNTETTNKAACSALQIVQVSQECEKTTDNASTSESTNGGYETPTPSIVRAEVQTLQEYKKTESDKTTNEATQHIAQVLPGCEKTTNGNAKTSKRTAVGKVVRAKRHITNIGTNSTGGKQ